MSVHILYFLISYMNLLRTKIFSEDTIPLT